MAGLNLLPACLFGAETAQAVTLTALPDRVRVEIAGQLFTEYVHGDGASRPYCYPILAVDGQGLTRDFPMKQTPGRTVIIPGTGPCGLRTAWSTGLILE